MWVKDKIKLSCTIPSTKQNALSISILTFPEIHNYGRYIWWETRRNVQACSVSQCWESFPKHCGPWPKTNHLFLDSWPNLAPNYMLRYSKQTNVHTKREKTTKPFWKHLKSPMRAAGDRYRLTRVCYGCWKLTADSFFIDTVYSSKLCFHGSLFLSTADVIRVMWLYHIHHTSCVLTALSLIFTA